MLALAICLACSPAVAVEPAGQPATREAADTRSFAIARQSLVNALDQLSVQSGLQIAYAADLAQGVESPGVSGRMTALEALAQLLKGTPLSFEPNGPNAVILNRTEQPGAALQLGTTTVISNQLGTVTEGTGSYTPGTIATATRLVLTPRGNTTVHQRRHAPAHG